MDEFSKNLQKGDRGQRPFGVLQKYIQIWDKNRPSLLTQGLMLHYRSKRRGFTTYTAGQLKAVATTYFKTEMGIEVKESEIKFDTVHVSFQVEIIF